MIGFDVLAIDELNGRTQIRCGKCFEKNIKILKFSTRLAMQLGFKPDENILDFNFSPNVGNMVYILGFPIKC